MVDLLLQVIFQDHRLQKLVAEAELQEDLEEALQLEVETVDPAEETLDLAEAEETTVSQMVDQEVQELHLLEHQQMEQVYLLHHQVQILWLYYRLEKLL